MNYGSILLIVCPLVFLAGFIDSVAGGGGIISLPAYLIAGLPVHMAYGTNKFASSCGTLVATAKYLKSGYVQLRQALISAAGALAGAWIGAQLVVLMPEKYLHYCLVIILPCVAVFLIFNKGFGKKQRSAVVGKKADILALVIGFVIGAYDGFFGPGTGTFLVIAFTGLLGLSLTAATGNAKVVNLASNVAALAAYIVRQGNVCCWHTGGGLCHRR